MSTPEFRPAPLLGNPHLQSILSSHRLRQWLRRRELAALNRSSRHTLLDCGDGVRLQGWYTPATSTDPRGLVVLLHGWEGSARSNYMLSTALALHNAGFAVFRLEFRDHGDGQHLNEGLFHSGRIGEVVGAIGDVARRWPVAPLMVAGFSLGGNFALRVGLHAEAAGLDLRHIAAVCPAIDPANVLRAMETGPWFYHYYFMQKWRRSLRRKQAAFPQRYRLDELLRRLNMRQLTEALVLREGEFASLDDYFNSYSIAGERLSRLPVPASILTSADDPVIPFDDFRNLQLPDHVRLLVTPNGGHCGFLENWRLGSWAERFVVDACSRA